MKTFIILALFFIMTIHGFSQTDTVPPVFYSITITPDTVTNYDTITTTIKTFDTISGIEYVQAYGKTSGGKLFACGTFVQLSDSIYQAKMIIPKWAEPGLWYVSEIFISDSANNYFDEYYQNSSESPDSFFVNSLYVDTIPPVFYSITITPDTVTYNDTITITVKTSDTLSGVEEIYVYTKDPKGNVISSLTFEQLSDSIYQAKSVIPKWIVSGICYVYNIAITDSANNFIEEYYQNSSVSPDTFFIDSSYIDTVPPVFYSITITPDTVSNNDTITITVKTSDNLSGVKEVFVYIKEPNGFQFSCGTFKQLSDSIYQAKWIIPQWVIPGIWYVYNISITDSANNYFDEYYQNSNESPDTFFVDSLTTQIKPFSESSNMIVFPNPTEDIFAIKYDKFIRAEVYDQTGRCMLKTDNNYISLGKYRSGIYIVKIVDKRNNFIYTKIIKS